MTRAAQAMTALTSQALTSANTARGEGTGHKAGRHHHRTKYSPEKVETARWMADTLGWGDVTIGYLLNVSPNTVRDWRAYRTRASG